MNWYITADMAISPSKQNEQLDTLFKVLHTRSISLHCCPLDVFLNQAIVSQFYAAYML